MEKYYKIECYGVRLFCDDCDIEMEYSKLNNDGFVHTCLKCQKVKISNEKFPTARFKISNNILY